VAYHFGPTCRPTQRLQQLHDTLNTLQEQPHVLAEL